MTTHTRTQAAIDREVWAEFDRRLEEYMQADKELGEAVQRQLRDLRETFEGLGK